jgi:hypothetical protein
MAIQIGGTVVIDDNRDIINVGIISASSIGVSSINADSIGVSSINAGSINASSFNLDGEPFTGKIDISYNGELVANQAETIDLKGTGISSVTFNAGIATITIDGGDLDITASLFI